MFTEEAEQWYRGLGAEQKRVVTAAVDRLEIKGPALARPFADTIKRSRYHHMKELRPRPGNLRALFAFDAQRRGVVLIGGDKTNNWKGWYQPNIDRADRLYAQHLRQAGKELPWRARDGARSVTRSL